MLSKAIAFHVVMFGVTDSGRVKVFVRVRPPRPHENSRKEPMAVNVQELSSRVSSNSNDAAGCLESGQR